ncbi:MAG: type IV secretory system conjugative DNA transfer family protein [Clostridiales bacterium]|nr:type IV secretory system conjugative DNA transfer family protein [Clostridiales bacterium]
MKYSNKLLKGYEDMRLIGYEDAALPNTVSYDELPDTYLDGVLKMNRHKDGKLIQTYSAGESHVGVIAATRLGKTTSYVIPTILSFARQKVKRSMIISDPKGELYKSTAETLRKQGYDVKLLNFRDYKHSECWNMLTPIFRKYQKALKIAEEPEVVIDGDELKHKFNGKLYDDFDELQKQVEYHTEMMLDEVGNDIDMLCSMFITTEKLQDPYWEDSARELLKAFLWAMLEDSGKEAATPTRITEETFSFSTILTILAHFKDDNGTQYNDSGYFSVRKPTSRALQLAKNNLLENASNTRKCIVATFNTKMAVFRECAMRLITRCNSFDVETICDRPTAVFIDYRDEVKVHYQVISLFVQNAYRFLIDKANASGKGRLDVPFYFILDEFGNFPAMRDFETTISACAGRNIFFILIFQSYAQLNKVYGADVAEIIRDNLNMHVFFGSNNPATLRAFSEECGEYARISPLSALNGKSGDMEMYSIETIPLVTKSRLSHFAPGECIITEANSGYVMFSKLERYYQCPEFMGLPTAAETDYVCDVDPFDKKYVYEVKFKRKSMYDF